MRLINVNSLRLEEFAGTGAAPPYAILSHTWDDGEVTYHDFQDLELASDKPGFDKIRCACLQAKADGLAYAWVDTCCIDKSSSHELSEAINSMYQWYSNAAVCYVYLSDVPGRCPDLSSSDYVPPNHLRWIEAFEESRWFTRGWTLQELIAPRAVLFFGCEWNPIGTLAHMIDRVSDITNIQADVLDHSRPLSDLSIARRLSWAAKRHTSRLEDVAYSLLGILDVNMPLLYGEGSRAFLRLQEVIIHQSTDQSIFAWDAPAGFVDSRELLLAPSPCCFMNGSRIRRRRGIASESAFRINNKGLEIQLPILRRRLNDDPSSPDIILGILDCRYENSSQILALVLSQHPFSIHAGTHALELYVSGYERRVGDVTQYGRLMTVSSVELQDARSTFLTITKDLASQSYIHYFDRSDPGWFPIRFTGSGPSSLPTLKDVYPEHCWNAASKTMKLRTPSNRLGGIVVETPAGKSILIIFGLALTSEGPARTLHGLSLIDANCLIEPHAQVLCGNRLEPGGEVAEMQASQHERVTVRLWRGALTVSVDNAIDEHAIMSSSPTLMSPPTSPRATFRRTSSSSSRRRDSKVQDGYMRRPSDSFDSDNQPHWTSACAHCRDSRERREAERERRREAKESERRRHEQQQKFVTRAKQAGLGLSLGSIIADVAEFL